MKIIENKETIKWLNRDITEMIKCRFIKDCPYPLVRGYCSCAELIIPYDVSYCWPYVKRHTDKEKENEDIKK